MKCLLSTSEDSKLLVHCGGDRVVSGLYACTVCKGSKKKDCDKH